MPNTGSIRPFRPGLDGRGFRARLSPPTSTRVPRWALVTVPPQPEGHAGDKSPHAITVGVQGFVIVNEDITIVYDLADGDPTANEAAKYLRQLIIIAARCRGCDFY